MRLGNMVTGTLVLTLLFLSSCGGGEGPRKVAEQFMDRYYVQANISEAKALATPAMVQKIEEQFALFAQLVQAEKGKSHEASFALKEHNEQSGLTLDVTRLVNRGVSQGRYAYYKYETTITTKEADPVYKSIYLTLNLIDGAWRITQFDERSESGPSQTLR